MDEELKLENHITFVILLVVLPSIYYHSIDISSSAFGAIATSLAAILAIVFSISILAIQVVVDKYNSTVLNYFTHSKQMQLTLFLFLGTIILSIVIAGTEDCNKVICTVVFSLFLLCLYAFYQYFSMMLNIVDPQKLGKLLKAKCIDQVDSEKLKELRETASSMGEIAIKSLQRKEIATTLVYTGYVEDILNDVVKIIPDNEKPKNITVDAIEILLEQYQKIADEAILREENQVIVDVSERLFCSPFNQNGYRNKYIYTGSFPTWLQVAEKTIEKRVPARIGIIHHWLYLAGISSYGMFTGDDQLFKKYLDFLFGVNRVIIEKNDFYLFQEEIDHLSLSGIQSPSSAQRDLTNILDSRQYITSPIDPCHHCPLNSNYPSKSKQSIYASLCVTHNEPAYANSQNSFYFRF